jgi:pimeloyl-ACP methyl ester carboxylesterase
MPGFRASDGVELHAEVAGEGTPVVLSNGLAITLVNFAPQIAPLVAAGCRVVRWDYRGHGRSQVPTDPAAYSMDQVVDDLGRAADLASPGEPVVLGGLSFGGLASLHFALLRPERVRALMLFGSGPGFKNPEAAARWQAQCDRTAEFVRERGMRAFVEGKSGRTVVGLRPELPAARAAAEAAIAQDPLGVALFSQRVGGPAPPVMDELARIQVPTLVLVGALDEPYLRAADVMAAKLPRATRVVIPDAGHIANLEAPAAFDAAVVNFIRALPI